ncbi:GntR family transcriptional regulator [Prauserella marina]|uniref:DNA-binding transcriptional regulator, GntR family n=1 Tax=Prauserella marina TaxID=530584 RepID=A0A222VKX5_9PSEU|nr:GntR family transcriptional regulator [Prauserella marina]ASR34580.1 GntR family transcriptional regulator [Prauserella marina]PWV85794.1 GntR family transcriptional regulator [Prauserella marina]SDC45366.1 DNA-binding transcriptional regulator, GntR family [Prauserella marina]
MTTSLERASRRGSATDNAYQHIKHLILVNELAPGAELREAALTESTGFGRSPVREALRRLVQEGFVEVRPRQGYRVSFVTIDGVRDLFELRLLLEPAAVELAALRAPYDELTELGTLARTTYSPGQAGGYETFLKAGRDFHVRIAKATGNERLASTLEVLLDEMQRLFFLSLGDPASASDMTREHRALYDALLARDVPRARQVVVDQIEAGRDRVLDRLAAAGRPEAPRPSGSGD